MSTWANHAAAVIANGMKAAPADMPLPERIKAVRKLKPYEYQATSWGRKTWTRAQRDYLVRFGYQPRTLAARGARGELDGQPALPLLSPLEQAKNKGLARLAMRGPAHG